jgi:hypothetical protein
MAPSIEPSQPSDVESDLSDLEYYRDRCHALETAVTGARAVLSVADDSPLPPIAGERCRRAADHVRLLLAADTDHPMFGAVALLREDLQHVLNLLTGVGDGR